MSAPAENQSSNPNFTQRHEDRIAGVEESVSQLKLSVYGSEKNGYDGLQKRVDKLEKGLLSKILTRQNITIFILAIPAIAAVIGLFFKN